MPKRDDINRVLIIGSGPIVIGQACEFDYSGTQACKALRGLGYEVVLVNSNPATIMTDPVMADQTFIAPLNVASLTEIIARTRPDALLPRLPGSSLRAGAGALAGPGGSPGCHAPSAGSSGGSAGNGLYSNMSKPSSRTCRRLYL